MVKRVGQKCRRRVKLSVRSKELKNEIKQEKQRKAKLQRKREAQREKKRAEAAAKGVERVYTPGLRTLLVGEGNFSFTRALVRRWEQERLEASGGEPPSCVEDLVGWKVVSTCLDTKDELVSKYPDVKEIVREIKASGVTVHCGIDATNLLASKRLTKSLLELCEGGEDSMEEEEEEEKSNIKHEDFGFDLIIFNFPHLGLGIKDTEQNIQVHQELIQKFLLSAHAVLAKNGKVHITLKTGEPYDSWRVPKIAVDTGLFRVHSSIPFDPAHFDGYTHRRTVGAPTKEVPANVDVHSDKTESITMIFTKADAERSKKQLAKTKKRAAKESEDSSDEE